MWFSLGLSVTLLITIPGLGKIGLPRLRFKHAGPPSAADSLPPYWKNPSLLALEDRIVLAGLKPLQPGPSGIQIASDPRQLMVSLDPDSGFVGIATEMGDVELGESARLPLSAYSADLSRRTFERLWEARSRQSINSLGEATPAATTQRSGLSVQLPSPLPRRVQSILGPGGPAINVYGSEQITISGTSNWTNQQVGILGQKKSLFPSLDMQQNLDIRLEGQLSDRIRVNLLQNSANQIPLANRIAINYKGDEDALFQEVDLGNTNLSLPGTQYVSYSGKNEGLFGAKATSRLGPLDMTILASKQEGRSERASYAGGASSQTQTIRDLEYIQGTYFFLNDPNENAPYGYTIDESSLRVYRDDNIASNDVNVTPGWAWPDPRQIGIGTSADSAQLGTGPYSVRGNYDQLNPGADRDYEVLSDVYGPGFKVLRLTQPLTGTQRLAVTYRRQRLGPGSQPVDTVETIGGFRAADSSLVMKLIRVPRDLIGADGATLEAGYDTTRALFRTHDLELRNFYRLAGQRVDLATLQISVRKGQDVPPINTLQAEGTAVPYLEVVGLDNRDESAGTPIAGHDGHLDATSISNFGRPFVDTENGLLFLPDPRPFAPRLGGGGKPFERFVDSLLFRRATLTGPADSPNEPNAKIYDRYNVQTETDAAYYIDLQFNAQRASGEITLGRGNILEGSDVVTINGQALQRGRDYDIDYDLGRVTLKRQLGPADQLNVDYSYAPLFQQAGRTLLGSAFNLEGRDRSFGGAFLYESRGAQDLRPRLGEEPSRSLIADLNTDWTLRPDWLTRFTDWLPGVRTTTPSDLRVQAEVGASFPNPNTRNEVYIDDMEGVRDAVSLAMDPLHWRWSSVPTLSDGSDSDRRPVRPRSALADSDLIRDAEVHWYSPYAVVKEHDLKPTMTDAEGGQNNRQVLAISIPRRPLTSNPNQSLWAGLTYPLDAAGIDLSKSQFIELWVNDFNDYHDPADSIPRVRGKHVKLHIDLGAVSEDEMRAPDEPPDGVLNSEDKLPRDNQLDVTTGNNEDTGLDGVLTPGETRIRDLQTAGPGDPEGDNYGAPVGGLEEIDARRYQGINGTEGNKNLFPYPDTEDLNLDGILNRDENYFEYTIDLGDDHQPYLVTDLRSLANHGVQGYSGLSRDNGWRRYRIPIDDSLRVQFGIPDFTTIRHLRLWLEGVQLPDRPAESTRVNGKQVERPLVLLGSLDIVGSRWRAVEIDPEDAKVGATLTLDAVNSVDNADVYSPLPFDPGTTLNGSQSLTRREQSIALEFTRLRPGRTIEAFKTFSVDEDYSRYGKLNWYVTGFGVKDSLNVTTNAGLYYFVRFASDENETGYYEFRSPLPVFNGALAWKNERLDLTELSNIKLDPRYTAVHDTLAVPRAAGSLDTLIVVGRPSFTRLRRVSIGLVNERPDVPYEVGQFWFDELRATDVAKDAGHAQRVSVGGHMANLLQYNFSWNGRDANFLSVGETRGSGSSSDSYAFSTNMDVHRFFEGTGIVLPVTFNFSQNSAKPRFSAGDDIVRSAQDQQRSESFADSRGWTVSYSRATSDRTNPFIKYTLNGITANFSAQNSHGRNPVTADQTTTYSGGINYSIAPRSALALPLPFLKPRFFPLPERFYVNYRVDERQSSTADRQTGSDTFIPRSTVGGRSAGITVGSDIRPFDFLHHHYEAVRNLNLAYRPVPGLFNGSLNLGEVVSWAQNVDANYTPHLGPWLRPQLGWSSRYAQNNGPELSPDLSVRGIGNGQQGTMRWDLPFDGLARATTARRDTGRAGPHDPMWRRLLARLGTVSTDFSVRKSSNYSRLTGRPNFSYLFGLSDDPGVFNPLNPVARSRMSASPGNQSSKSLDWRTSARTTLKLPWSASIQTSGEVTSQTTETNGAERGTDAVRFPDMQFDYGQLATAIRLDRFLRNPRLRTAFNRSSSTDYNNGRSSKSSESRSLQLQPLLELGGDFGGGTRLQLSVEHRSTQREVLQLGRSVQYEANTDLNMNLNRSFSQGQKINFLGRESTVRSSVSIGIATVYSRQTGRIEQLLNGRMQPSNQSSRDRISVNANGSYGFSSNVNGNAVLGFSQDQDKIRKLVSRSVRVELSARFSF